MDIYLDKIRNIYDHLIVYFKCLIMRFATLDTKPRFGTPFMVFEDHSNAYLYHHIRLCRLTLIFVK